MDCFFRDLPEVGRHMPKCTLQCQDFACEPRSKLRHRSLCVDAFHAFRGELIASQWRIEAIETQQKALQAEVTEAQGLRQKVGLSWNVREIPGGSFGSRRRRSSPVRRCETEMADFCKVVPGGPSIGC